MLAEFDPCLMRLQQHPPLKDEIASHSLAMTDVGRHTARLRAAQGLPLPSRLSGSHGCGLARKKRWKGQTKKAGCHRGQPLPSRIISSGLTASHEKYLTYKWWRPSVKFLARSETGKNIDEFIFFWFW